jgi:hypothetical protein
MSVAGITKKREIIKQKKESTDGESSGSYHPPDRLTDEKIVDFCKERGLILEQVNEWEIPRMKMNLATINYPLLISKALYL